MKLDRSLSIGLHVPSFSADALPSPADYSAFFRRAESLGFDAIWTEDRILHPAPMLDPLVLLAWAAASTERMLLGTAVMLLNLRRAAVVAREIATLQHLSDGRLAIGVSLGGRPEEYSGLDVPMNRRVGVFRESVAVLRGLNSGEDFHYRSPSSGASDFRFDGAAVRPSAAVPLLMGGVVPAAIRRAGELAEGWIMAPFGDLDDFARGWAMARDAAAAAGRNPDALVTGRLLYVCADPDKARARAQLKPFLEVYYGNLLDVDRDAVFGPADEVAEQLALQVDAGISHLMLGVPSLDIAQLEYLASAVLPRLRSR